MININYYVGIDVGGTTTKIGIIDENGQMIAFDKKKTNVEDDGKNILIDIVNQLEELLKNNNLEKSNIKAVGIGIPGPVKKDGTIEFAVNIGWKNKLNIKEELEKLIKIPVVAVNDATVGVLGETWKGSAKGIKNAVLITLGTGVGGGILIDGKILYGTLGEAGEIGHIIISDTKRYLSSKCKCGKIGCLEQYVSGTGIVSVAKYMAKFENDKTEFSKKVEAENIIASDIWNAVKNKDEFAIKVAKIFADNMAKAIDILYKINNPEIIIIGGGMAECGQIILDYIKEAYERGYKSTFSNPKIVLAELENKAGIYGAARLAMLEN